MGSLICNVPPDARLLRCCPDEEVAGTRSSGGGGGGGGRPAAVRQGPSPYPKLEAYLTGMACQVRFGTL